jgi:hypothetical protein
MDSPEDNHKQYEDLLVECFEKILKLAPRKCEDLKKQAKRAIGKFHNSGLQSCVLSSLENDNHSFKGCYFSKNYALIIFYLLQNS